MTPARVIAAQAEPPALESPRQQGSAASSTVNLWVGPSPRDEFAMPAHQRFRTDDPTPPQRPRAQPAQRRQQHPIFRLQPRTTDPDDVTPSPHAATPEARHPLPPGYDHEGQPARAPPALPRTRSTTTRKRSCRTRDSTRNEVTEPHRLQKRRQPPPPNTARSHPVDHSGRQPAQTPSPANREGDSRGALALGSSSCEFRCRG